MSRGIRISTVILSVIMISSCATERIQVVQKEYLECRTPKTRYAFGKNKPTHAIKSNNQRYTKNLYHPARNNRLNGYLSKNFTRKDKDPGKLNYDLKEYKNYHIPEYFSRNELLFIRQTIESSGMNLYYYELKKLPYPVRIINEPKEIIISPSQDDMLSSINKSNNESEYSNIVLKQENIDDILPNESSNEAGVSISNTVKSDQSQETPFHKRETFILMMAILAGLIPLATIKATPKLAANISFWAAMNPWKTRFMFAGIQIALGTAGFMLGDKLAESGIHFSNLSRDLLLGAFLTSSMLYPVKHTSIRFFKHSYLKQKAFDLALAISGFMLMVNVGNDPGMSASLTSMVNFKAHEQQNVNMLNDHHQAPKQLLYYQNDKQLQDKQTAPQNKETSRGLKSLYTFLVVLAGLALGLVLAAAACGLACNGMEGLSALVAIGGGILLIGLMILVIKSIWHPMHKKRIKPSKSTESVPKEGTLLV
jgi:hypothetical protein